MLQIYPGSAHRSTTWRYPWAERPFSPASWKILVRTRWASILLPPSPVSVFTHRFKRLCNYSRHIMREHTASNKLEASVSWMEQISFVGSLLRYVWHETDVGKIKEAAFFLLFCRTSFLCIREGGEGCLKKEKIKTWYPLVLTLFKCWYVIASCRFLI